MVSMMILALFGVSALTSNTVDVTEYVKQTGGSFWDASVTAIYTYPDGVYLENGPKPVAWGAKEEYPPRIAFTAKPKKVAQAIAAESVVNVPRAEETYEAKSSPQADVEDLGLLGKKEKNLAVSNDEILSYFEKKVTTKNGNEKTGAFVIPNQAPTVEAPKSRAELELK